MDAHFRAQLAQEATDRETVFGFGLRRPWAIRINQNVEVGFPDPVQGPTREVAFALTASLNAYFTPYAVISEKFEIYRISSFERSFRFYEWRAVIVYEFLDHPVQGCHRSGKSGKSQGKVREVREK